MSIGLCPVLTSVATSSPLSATNESWLLILVDVSAAQASSTDGAAATNAMDAPTKSPASVVVDQQRPRQSRPVSSEVLNTGAKEPTPQNCSNGSVTQDPLVSYWQSRTSEARSRSHASSSDDGAELTLAERSIIAKRSVEETRQQHLFWTNRLRLLKSEALKIETKQHQQPASTNSTQEHTATNVSSFATQTTTAQLEEGRRREAGIRKERAAAIRLQRVTHAKTLREAQRAMLENRRELSRQTKIHAENHASIVEALRTEDFEERCRRRDKIHHEKVAMMLKRVRDAAMRAEEAKLLYEEKIQQRQEDEEAQQLEIIAIVQESSKLVQKIRQLRKGGQNPSTSGE